MAAAWLVFSIQLCFAADRTQISIITATNAVEESLGMFNFELRLAEPLNAPASATIIAGPQFSYRAPYSYVGFTNVVSFAAGETVKKLSVQIRDNDAIAVPEKGYLRLDRVSTNLVLGTYEQAFSILDDETAIGLIGGGRINEDSNAVEFIISRAGAIHRRFTVPWRTIDRSARSGADFVGTNGVTVFEPGEARKTNYVSLLRNPATNAPLSFEVRLGTSEADFVDIGGIAFELHDAEGLLLPGALDESKVAPPAVGAVVALALDGQSNILAGFGHSTSGDRFYISRYLPDLTRDPSFNSAEQAGKLLSLLTAPEGTLVVSAPSNTVTLVTRLTPDGALDTNYAVRLNSQISGAEVDSSGNLLLSGAFTKVNEQDVHRIVRITPNGAIDPTFLKATNVSGTPTFILPLSNGGAVVGAGYQNPGVEKASVTRLNADGSRDSSFAVSPSLPPLQKMFPFPDGTFLGVVDTWTAPFRILPDGRSHTMLAPPLNVSKIVPAPDGRFYCIGGSFAPVLHRRFIDGTIDESFTPVIAGSLGAVLPLGDRILVGGSLTHVNGRQVSGNIAALWADMPGGAATTIAWNGRRFTSLEGEGVRMLPISRFGSADHRMVVTYSANSASAVEGEDFSRMQGQVVFEPDERLHQVPLALLDDMVTELNEEVELTLQVVPDWSQTLGSSSAKITILSEESRVAFKASDVTISEVENRVAIQMTRSGPANEPVEIQLTVSPAIIGGAARTNKVRFPMGSSESSVTLSDFDDTTVGETKRYLVEAIGPTNVIEGMAPVTITVIDNDRFFGAGEGADYASARIKMLPESRAQLGSITRLHGISVASRPKIDGFGYPLLDSTPPPTGSVAEFPNGTFLVEGSYYSGAPYRIVSSNGSTLKETTLKVSAAAPSSQPVYNQVGDLVYVLQSTQFGLSERPTFLHTVSSDGAVTLLSTNSIYASLGFGQANMQVQKSGHILLGAARLWASIYNFGPYSLFPHDVRLPSPFYQKDLVRLTPEGVLDTNFAAAFSGRLGVGGFIRDVALMQDDKIIVLGDFTHYNREEVSNVIRLFPNGQLDKDFAPPAEIQSPVPNYIRGIEPAQDGKLFILIDDSSKSLIRLAADGKQETGFQPPATDGRIWSVGEYPDGRLVMSGEFKHVNGQPRYQIAFLAPDGSLLPDYPFTFKSIDPSGKSAVFWSRGPGQIELEQSTDLQNWQVVSTNSVTYGDKNLTLPSQQGSRAFYRAKRHVPPVTAARSEP
ncbi:MAG TPA: Calx-beta domain-containing protein [Methylomirabilota bacterium]|nr:Calx-beta domain-containing protein [Methylomirabilota bacterium]